MSSTAVVKPKERPVYSSPMFQRTVQFNSLQAQRVMERSFEKVSRSLFFVDVVMHIIGDRSKTKKVEEIVLGHIEKAKGLFEKEDQRLDKLMQGNGIDILPTYDHPKVYEIKINSPQLARYAAIIKQLDALTEKVDTLWLNGVFDSEQRLDGNHQWQKQVVTLANRIIGIETYTRVSIQKAGNQSEVEQELSEKEVTIPTAKVAIA